jgi:uncharacterized membrane protein YuzA (DUF378 family)
MATMTNATSFTTLPKLSAVDWIALILMIVGSLNWGLVGGFNFNLVSAILGEQTMASRIVYVLVGLAGLYSLTLLARLRTRL